MVEPKSIALLASLSCLALATAALARTPRGPLPWSFGLGMLGFAAEALVGLRLLGTDLPDDRLFWLRIVRIVGLVLVVPWGVFVAVLAAPSGASLPSRRRLGLVAGSVLVSGASAVVASTPAFDISDIPGPFHAAPLAPVGTAAIVVELLATVGILAGLEACLRTSHGFGRWRIKHLVLGLGGIFLVRFYLLSQVLLFQVVLAVYLTTGAATVFVGNLLIGASLARAHLGSVGVSVSRQILFRSVVVSVLGLYLLGAGALAWLLSRAGIPEETFWGSLAVFASALGLAAVLLSENVRWRIKRFISLHFYRSKYDYREQWSAFTKRLGSLLALEELAPQLLEAVTAAVGTVQGALYLADGTGDRFYLAGAVGIRRSRAVLDEGPALIARLRARRAPVPLENGRGGRRPELLLPGELAASFPDASVVVPLHWRDSLSGLMLLGPERTGAAYTPEDLEFLATVGEQAAGAIVTARLSEAVAQAREFEAFHRLTSFVIHDLKNSTSALSMLSQNALVHFEDPEFQRDAIRTVSRTVDRMKALLARLTAAPDPAPLPFQAVDLAGLLREATAPLGATPGVRVVTDLVPAPPVLGDAEALLRVIENLLTNAVEALEGEGVVTVRLYEEPGWVVVSVADTGCGIPDEVLRTSLFAPFRSTKKGGWGIGLYQTKGIVERHGGRIEAASAVGEGTTFWVRLPGPRPALAAGARA